MSIDSKDDQGTSIALINYFLTEYQIIIIVTKREYDRPKIFRQSIDKDSTTSLSILELCAQRLLIDFNGLDGNWRHNKQISKSEKLIMETALTLEPTVTDFMRISLQNYPGSILVREKKIKMYKFIQDYLDKIASLVFPNELKKEIEDCELICISPHGVLHLVPFHALKWNEVGGKPQYVIQKFGICYTPNLDILKFTQSKNPKRKNFNFEPRAFLLVCSGKKDDYFLFEEDISLIKGIRDWDRDLTILNGVDSNRASKLNIQNHICKKDIIHFSTHGLFALDRSHNIGKSGLIVTGEAGYLPDELSMADNSMDIGKQYLLTDEEIFNLKLDSTLVTLRSCSSGRSVIKAGDELIGLSRALLYAGTPSIIASLWNVNIESSKVLLSIFYSLWLNKEHPIPKWKAFQQAQNSLILMDNEKYSHPYHWAPFILIGDWI